MRGEDINLLIEHLDIALLIELRIASTGAPVKMILKFLITLPTLPFPG